MKHFREVLGDIDPGPLLEQLADIPTAMAEEECFPYDQHTLMWRRMTEWTVKKAGAVTYSEHNIVLRYLTLGQERETGRLYLYEGDRTREEWDRPFFRTLSAARPIVQRVLSAVGDMLSHVIITRLPPGGRIAEHTDHWPGVSRFWDRHQIPLSGQTLFRCGDEELRLKPGKAYWFDNGLPHSVENVGDFDRLTMIIDAHLW